MWLGGIAVIQEKLGGAVRGARARVSEGQYSSENLYPQNVNLRYF